VEDWHLVVLLVLTIVGFVVLMMYGVQAFGPKR